MKKALAGLLAAAVLPAFSPAARAQNLEEIFRKVKSHAVTAEIEVPKAGAEGVIIAQGGNIGGWSLYAKGGKLKYCYNLLGVQYFYVEATSPVAAGAHQVRMEFAYAGGGLGKGGQVSLYVDGNLQPPAGASVAHGALPSPPL